MFFDNPRIWSKHWTSDIWIYVHHVQYAWRWSFYFETCSVRHPTTKSGRWRGFYQYVVMTVPWLFIMNFEWYLYMLTYFHKLGMKDIYMINNMVWLWFPINIRGSVEMLSIIWLVIETFWKGQQNLSFKHYFMRLINTKKLMLLLKYSTQFLIIWQLEDFSTQNKTPFCLLPNHCFRRNTPGQSTPGQATPGQATPGQNIPGGTESEDSEWSISNTRIRARYLKNFEIVLSCEKHLYSKLDYHHKNINNID